MPAETKPPIEVVANELGRSVEAVKQFLRRVLPKGQLPWVEKRRWLPDEVDAAKNGQKADIPRSPAAIRKWKEGHGCRTSKGELTEEDPERNVRSVRETAADIGTRVCISPAEERHSPVVQGWHRRDHVQGSSARAPRRYPVLEAIPRAEGVACPEWISRPVAQREGAHY